jgi:uncharacterized protein (UPF0262 family)
MIRFGISPLWGGVRRCGGLNSVWSYGRKGVCSDVLSDESKSVSSSEFESAMSQPILDIMRGKIVLPVAVSGGPDSLALCLLLQRWLKEKSMRGVVVSL